MTVDGPLDFGLIIIGDEILRGQRQDAHFLHFRQWLGQQGRALAWCWLLPDDPEILVQHFTRSLAGPHPVFCCGGIGATPDDLTRECVARAAGVSLERHPGAAAEIEGRFGDAAYPTRILMADLPQGSTLIPNPYNRIPGFSLGEHHFLPGFPEMAWPMAAWVLQQRYTATPQPLAERSVRVLDTPESALVPLLQRLTPRYPDLKLFSLPHLGTPMTVEVGFRGRHGLEQAFADLLRELAAEGRSWE